MSKQLLRPILKYPGGKLREWKIIKPNLPSKFNNYYEPFVGGGSTWLNTSANHYYINDLSTDLMNLYTYIKDENQQFIKIIKVIIKAWKMPYMNIIINKNPNVLMSGDTKVHQFINEVFPKFFNGIKYLIPNKHIVQKQLTKSVNLRVSALQRKKKKYGKVVKLPMNALTAVKTALYTLLRTTYNSTKNKLVKTATYWYLREYAYSSMFRFNKSGGFNVPYGGSSYNSKSLLPKLKLALSSRFQHKIQSTSLLNTDFYEALKQDSPKTNDFVFLDPPYDTAFSTYDKNKFGKNKQVELAKYLKNDLNAHFMLIIKSSKLINDLYKDGEKVVGGKGTLRIKRFDKRYQVSFQNRNNQRASHLLIMNY